MPLKFRLLRADEIDCRISTCNQYGVGLLLYKDARCDQNILDETVGAFNWQREHTRDNANCIVSIWDKNKSQWIKKEDVGKESFTEKEKGLASDSFKRACFNWGIGRELYTAPNMFVFARDLERHEQKNGKWTCSDSFIVKSIEYDDEKITKVIITDEKNGKDITFDKSKKKAAKSKKSSNDVIKTISEDNFTLNDLTKAISENGIDEKFACNLYAVNSFSELSKTKAWNMYQHISDIKEKMKEGK